MIQETTIGREPSDIERRDMKMIGEQSPQQFFSAKLALKEQEFMKKFVPFDAACARLDFKDEIARVERESERIHGYVTKDAVLKVDISDLDKYGDADRFDLVDHNEEVEGRLIDNVRTQVKIGWTVRYKCKQRGHGVSVFMPVDVYEEKFLKKKKKEE